MQQKFFHRVSKGFAPKWNHMTWVIGGHQKFTTCKPNKLFLPPTLRRHFAAAKTKKKRVSPNGLTLFLVRVTGVEPAASWTPFKRATKLRYTRIFGTLKILSCLATFVNNYFCFLKKYLLCRFSQATLLYYNICIKKSTLNFKNINKILKTSTILFYCNPYHTCGKIIPDIFGGYDYDLCRSNWKRKK